MYAFTTVVVNLSYSLISGQTSDDTLTSTSGNSLIKKFFKIASFSELAYECKKPTATLSNFSLLILVAKFLN